MANRFLLQFKQGLDKDWILKSDNINEDKKKHFIDIL
tara:strand:- start:151 stop:261 length:111 start_codon:yes stop_codon:yes gene_type:complete